MRVPFNLVTNVIRKNNGCDVQRHLNTEPEVKKSVKIMAEDA